MRKSIGSHLGLSLVAFAIGIVIGGSIEAAIHHNTIQLKVMPYGDVNVAPKVGDVIDWTPFDKSQTLNVQFTHEEKPCSLTTDNTCTITSQAGPGVYLYDCSGGAACPDPGIGPITTTNRSSLVVRLLEMFNSFVLTIDHFFGFTDDSAHRTQSVPTASGSPQAMHASAPAEIYCSNNTTMAPAVSGAPNGTIYWTSPHPFTLTMDAAICKEKASDPNVVQQCTLTNVTAGQVSHYTALEQSCSNQPSASQTITVQ
ncbi:MAG TPA: hypothetical protein VGM11_12460 [Acidobacteriaceae bacterium]|jgi:plastocyanin